MPIRVLVIDDSLTVRKHLIEVLSADPEFEVAGEGEDGRAAIELCQQLKPDVLSMDMMMPVMTGLAATEYIMAYYPTPILIVSASINRGEAMKTLDALVAGAVEVMDKPPAEEVREDAWCRQYKSTLKLVSRIKVIRHIKGKLGLAAAPPSPGALRAPPSPGGRGEKDSAPRKARRESGGPYELVAIGTSTGGPQALMAILPQLPADFDLPILLVLHLDPRFDDSFREWLRGYTNIDVQHATDGMPLPRPGARKLVLARANQHLVVRKGGLYLNQDRERHSCRPSVDVLFESVATELGPRAIACLLTGMGRDGAAGLLAVRKAGGMTLAQDEASSVIFGMPGEAIALGAAAQVLSLGEFAPALAKLARESLGTRNSELETRNLKL